MPIPVSLFGLATIPNIAPVDGDFSEVMASAHKFGAWTLAALVALHVAAALKHQFGDRDAILYRMWPRGAGGRPRRRGVCPERYGPQRPSS